MSELIEGTDGNDILVGALVLAGKGDDVINGIAGQEATLIYRPGDGNDTLVPFLQTYPNSKQPPAYVGNTVIRFAPGIRPEDLQATGQIALGYEFYTRTNVSFKNQEGSISAINLTRIEFADGPTWDRAAIELFLSTGQVPTSDMFIDRRDTVDDRTLNLGTGSDTLLGGQGAEQVHGGAGHDSLDGGAGNDALAGDAGDDTLAGGTGDDFLSGGEGADTYVFQIGDGEDTLYADAQDTLVLGAGLTRASLYADRLNGSQPITVFFEGQQRTSITFGVIGGDNLPGLVRFADGSTMTNLEILDAAANPRSVLFQGTAGEDLLIGAGGNDTLNGLAGNDWLDGGRGNDTLEGGQGNDWIGAASGSDTVIFNAGDGQDIVLLGANSKLMLGAGLTRADARVATETDSAGVRHVMLTFQGRTDVISLQDLAEEGNGTVVFADGLSQSMADLLHEGLHIDQILTGTADRDTLTGGVGNDTLTGLAGNDLLDGGEGRDSIDGGAGADTLRGGLGNDTLIGGKGNDVYRFARGDGQDGIVDTDSTWFNSDVLQLSGVATNQLWFTRSGNNLNIAILGTQDKVTVQDWFKGSSYRLEKITAMDSGKSLSVAKVNSLVSAMAGFSIDPATTPQLPANTPASITRLVASSWV